MVTGLPRNARRLCRRICDSCDEVEFLATVRDAEYREALVTVGCEEARTYEEATVEACECFFAKTHYVREVSFSRESACRVEHIVGDGKVREVGHEGLRHGNIAALVRDFIQAFVYRLYTVKLSVRRYADVPFIAFVLCGFVDRHCVFLSALPFRVCPVGAT